MRPRHGVFAAPWQQRLPVGVEPLPRELPYWDYNTDVPLSRALTIDVDAVFEQCGLADDAQVSFVALWRSTGSGLRTLAAREIVGRDWRTAQYELGFTLTGTEVGGTVTLTTQLLLEHPGSSLDPVAPRRPGSVLWSDERDLRLQGDAARFPMDLVDFRKEVYPNGAGWHLKIGRELEAAAMGSILLLINSENKPLAQAVARGADPKPVDRIVLSAMYADVTRTMIEHALAQPDFDDETDYPDESLGQILRALCRRTFPGEPISELRLRYENSSTMFATDIQGGVRIFENAS